MASDTIAFGRSFYINPNAELSFSPATIKVAPRAPYLYSSAPDRRGTYISEEFPSLPDLPSQSLTGTVSSHTVTSADFVVTLRRIDDLRNDEEEEDRPSDRAYELALMVLAETAALMSLGFPRASASVGPNRGLRITWAWGNREVRLVVGGGSANKSYIYAESGREHGLVYTVDGPHLARHLEWAMREP